MVADYRVRFERSMAAGVYCVHYLLLGDFIYLLTCLIYIYCTRKQYTTHTVSSQWTLKLFSYLFLVTIRLADYQGTHSSSIWFKTVLLNTNLAIKNALRARLATIIMAQILLLLLICILLYSGITLLSTKLNLADRVSPFLNDSFILGWLTLVCSGYIIVLFVYGVSPIKMIVWPELFNCRLMTAPDSLYIPLWKFVHIILLSYHQPLCRYYLSI